MQVMPKLIVMCVVMAICLSIPALVSAWRSSVCSGTPMAYCWNCCYQSGYEIDTDSTDTCMCVSDV